MDGLLVFRRGYNLGNGLDHITHSPKRTDLGAGQKHRKEGIDSSAPFLVVEDEGRREEKPEE